jgi:hypothetical protein
VGVTDCAEIYAYVGNNPVNFTDPLGTGPLGAAIGGWIGGAGAGALGIESGRLDALAVAAGRYAGRAAGSAIEDSVANILNSLLPLDKGGRIFGQKAGCGSKAGQDAAHAAKGSDPLQRPTDDYKIDPDTGDVYAPGEGEPIANANDYIGQKR